MFYYWIDKQEAVYILIGYTVLVALAFFIYYLKGHRINFKKMSAFQTFTFIVACLTSLAFYISYWIWLYRIKYYWRYRGIDWKLMGDWLTFFIFSLIGQSILWLIIWFVWYKKKKEKIISKVITHKIIIPKEEKKRGDRFCQSCGSKLKNERYCPNCGAKSGEVYKDFSSPRRITSWWWIIIIVFAVIIGIIIIVSIITANQANIEASKVASQQHPFWWTK